jgi:methionine synthase I (cobalamin-dependent)
LQAEYLISSGVDAILIETMYDLREAIAAVKAVRSVSDDITIMATMTFDKKKRGFFTIMGDIPSKCYHELKNSGADVVGANCTLDSDDMLELAILSRDLIDLQLLFQANAGQPQFVDGNVLYPQTPEHYANKMIEILQFADIIGGCCGTTPEYIKKIRELMD